MTFLKQHSYLTPWLALVGGVAVVGLVDPTFFKPDTLIQLTANSMTLMLMAVGLTFVIYIGSIDLSAQAVAAVSSVILAQLLPDLGWFALPAALLGGASIGLISGIVFGLLRVPSLVATLAVGGIAASSALWLSGSRSLAIPATYRETYLAWIAADALGLPNVIWVSALAVAIAVLIERATPFGKMMKSVGCSEPASMVAGIRVRTIKVMAFTLAGTYAGLAGIVLGARLATGSPTIANEFLLPAIAAVVLGGTSLVGGTGGVIFTVAGTLMITVIRTGMTFVGVDAFAQQIVFGILLILAIGLNSARGASNAVK